ncbi:MAG TPA: subclass B3 metallo-beta-lactamase [Duganella sp.]|jgi:metallo-beta-lactamase class B
MSTALATSLPALLTLLMTPALAEDWNDPQEPFAVFGNTYYVGTRGLSSVLITSPQGHILIDGGSPESAPMIAQHIRQLGFKLEDIKLILNSHDHFDHAGGVAALQRLSGAAVLASVQGEKVLRSGKPSKGDPQYGDLSSMTPVVNTRAVADGEVVKLGPLAVTARYTPGHTQGGVSWTWRSSENGKSAAMVYADSLNAFAHKPFRYSGSKTYPTALADLRKSITTVASLDCDILISAHPGASALWERLVKQSATGNAAFINRQACRDYAAAGTKRLNETLAEEAAGK